MPSKWAKHTLPKSSKILHYRQTHAENFQNVNSFDQLPTLTNFWAGKKTPEAAAGHDTLVLRTKTLLASMAHERTDRTSRRAEIPPPEEAALRAAPQREAATVGGRFP